MRTHTGKNPPSIGNGKNVPAAPDFIIKPFVCITRKELRDYNSSTFEVVGVASWMDRGGEIAAIFQSAREQGLISARKIYFSQVEFILRKLVVFTVLVEIKRFCFTVCNLQK